MRAIIRTAVLTLVGALALAGLGPACDALFGKSVTIVVDGQVGQTFKVVDASVAAVLTNQGVALTARDYVSPDLSTPVSDGMLIDIQHARPVSLVLNGQAGVYWTFATTVGRVIEALGLSESSIRQSLPGDTTVPLGGLALTIDTGHDVVVTAGGQTQAIHAYGTVADALVAAGITTDADDIITPAPRTILSDNLAITAIIVDTVTITRQVDVPFDISNSDDPNLAKGKVAIDTKGVVGVDQQTVVQTLHDGEVFAEDITASVRLTDPVTQVQRTGTKVVAPPAGTPDPGSAQAIAYTLVQDRGWSDDEYSCLVSLWNRESGWRVNASNPSGAYGIPQALPGSKMASAGADWATNPATQITWGLGYIAGRYGTPCGAWGHFQSRGWY